MASIKAFFWAVLILALLAGVGAGSAYLYRMWQTHQAAQTLDLAESYLNQSKAAEAEQLLAEKLDSGSRPGGAWVDRAVALRMRTLEQLGDKKAQKAFAEKVLDAKKPWARSGQEAWARAHLLLAQVALDAGQAEPALPHLKAVLDQKEGAYGKADAQLGLARIEMSKGNIKEAKASLDQLLAELPEDAPARAGVEHALGLCNVTLMLSLEPQEGDQIYVLEKGDTLDRLKRKFRISPEVLMSINQIPDPKRLTIGRRIKIPNLEFSIVVDKANNTLTLYNHNKFFKRYRVRTGQQDYMTPVGKFKVTNKMMSPTWRNPKDGQVYGPEAPGNELGCRWLGFHGVNLGIHEAVDPSTIGQYSSNGCVGMVKEDVIELFNLVPVGTPVEIKGQKKAPGSSTTTTKGLTASTN